MARNMALRRLWVVLVVGASPGAWSDSRAAGHCEATSDFCTCSRSINYTVQDPDVVAQTCDGTIIAGPFQCCSTLQGDYGNCSCSALRCTARLAGGCACRTTPSQKPFTTTCTAAQCCLHSESGGNGFWCYSSDGACDPWDQAIE